MYITLHGVNTAIKGGVTLAESIDRIALGLTGAVAWYLLFLNAWGSIPLACGLAFLCAALGHALLRGLPRVRRVTTAQARAELLRIAGLDDASAERALTALIAERWPEEQFRLAPVLKHPEATMSSGDVLNAWKANRDAERLVIAATCPCEPRAALYARGLRSPVVAVVDSRGLTRLLRALPAERLSAPPRRGFRDALAGLWASAAAARPSLRSALLALAMLGSYLLSGNAWYLFPALAVAAHTGAGLIRHGVGRRLFEPD